jgi:hypothetical protein
MDVPHHGIGLVDPVKGEGNKDRCDVSPHCESPDNTLKFTKVRDAQKLNQGGILCIK